MSLAAPAPAPEGVRMPPIGWRLDLQPAPEGARDLDLAKPQRGARTS